MKILSLPAFGFAIFTCFATNSFAADSTLTYSPDHNIKLVFYNTAPVRYSIQYKQFTILQPSYIDLELLDGKKLSSDVAIAKRTSAYINETIESPVPEKRKLIPNEYNEFTIHFKQPYILQFRVYNDGVAYRLLTSFKDSVVIKNEVAKFNFILNEEVLLPRIDKRQDADRYHTSFEGLYENMRIDSLAKDLITYSPILVTTRNGLKIGITESDLDNYPGMFLSGHAPAGLTGVFAPYPLEEKMTEGEFPQLIVTKRADYIARIKGTRSLPWRVLIIAANDKELPANDLVYRLAPPSRVEDISWIQPGTGTDEWIIGVNLFNVPFKAGVNTATYLYYIDFAKQFGLDRIMMDAGWSNYKDLFDINKEINMDTIAAYAKRKQIKLSMWTLCSTLDRQLDSALTQFNKWGVDFIMTDFMDRDDQKMVQFYHRIAAACANKKIMVMYHGAFPPKGFNRTWPHAITREGVLGSEFNIWSDKVTPEHDVTLPFTRMLSGPMDYEPGILNNATKTQFRSIEKQVMTQGTRCHQLAMFVVYESPIQIFSGNPSQAMLEPAFMQLLGSIPTVWDETIILDAKVGDYIITARRKNADWYIAGMTDWSPRTFKLPLSFLKGTFLATSCVDGINAANYPSDYQLSQKQLTASDSLEINMAPGGGFLIRLEKQP
ncbi:MAG: glycoside hydrolase family 97 protein [Bacteroidota bacterium]